jgi:hypothetical protein
MKNEDTIKIAYDTGVYTPAGWRSVTVTALASKTSSKMAEVTEVVLIDGDAPVGRASRTGAKRQTYNAAGIAAREVGARKRISSCRVLA